MNLVTRVVLNLLFFAGCFEKAVASKAVQMALHISSRQELHESC